jgi:hypothetical protein
MNLSFEIFDMTYGFKFFGYQVRGVCKYAPPSKSATLLEYGKPIQLKANETSELFCFPSTWGATKFQSVTDFGITMYVSNTSDFTIEQALNSFVATAEDNKRSIYLSNKEIGDLTSKSQDGYIYVRFNCSSSISITPDVWNTSDCAMESYLIRPNEEVALVANSQNVTVYRLRYEDFVGYDLIIEWNNAGNVTPYIADTCHFSITTTDSHLVLRPAKNIKRYSSYTVDSASLSTWASRVDADGYLYVRFKANLDGNIVFKTEKPAE